MTLLYRSASSGNWCKVLLVAAGERLDPRTGSSSNKTDPVDNVDPSCVLPSEFPCLLERNTRSEAKNGCIEEQIWILSIKWRKHIVGFQW